MAFDILSYHKQNKDRYGDVPLEDVAKDVFSRGGYDKEYTDYDTWKRAKGIDSIISEDLNKRKSLETPKEESSILRRTVADPLVGLVKGAVVGIPETLVGLADIPTMGKAGKLAEEGAKAVGLKTFKEAETMFDEMLSPEARESQRKVAEAKGFIPTIKTALENPSSIVQTVTESLAPMLMGGKIAGTLLKVGAKGISETAKLSRAVIAGGVGEGAVTAGQNIEQVRQETPEGDLTPGQVGLNVAAGAVTGVLGVLGGKIANRLGINDINTMMAGGTQQKTKILKSLFAGAIQEGLLEELPQSMQEQIAQNLSLDKPPLEGVPEAGAMGLLAGMAQSMGATSVGKVREQFTQSKINDPDYSGELERLKLGADLVGEIHTGLMTGKVGENPFTVNDAISIIDRGRVDGTFDDHDVDRLKELFPQLRTDLNNIIADSVIEKAKPIVESSLDRGLSREDIDKLMSDPQFQTTYNNYLDEVDKIGKKEEVPINMKQEIITKYSQLLPEFLPNGDKHPGISLVGSLNGLEGRQDIRNGKIEIADFSNNKERFERTVAHETAHEIFPMITNKMWGSLHKISDIENGTVKFNIDESNPQLKIALNLVESAHNIPFTKYLKDIKKDSTEWTDDSTGFGAEVIAEAWAVKQVGGRFESIARKTNPEAMKLADELFKGEISVNGTKVLDLVPNLQSQLTKEYPKSGLSLATISYPDKSIGISLNTLRLSENERGQGTGTKIVGQIKEYADKNNLKVEVHPQSQLVKFYERQGFVKDREGTWIYGKKAEVPAVERKIDQKHEFEIKEKGTKLPVELSRANPRYSYGQNKFTLNFEDEVDKAAYITAQNTKSKSDESYLQFVRKVTGLSDMAIRSYGQKVKDSIKLLAKNGKNGDVITVPKLKGDNIPSIKSEEAKSDEQVQAKTETKVKKSVTPKTKGPKIPKVFRDMPIESLNQFAEQKNKWAQMELDRRSEEKKGPKFSSSLQAKTDLPIVTLKDVQDVFKGQEVIQPGGINSPIYVKTVGGQYLTVENVDHISPDEIAFEIAYGRPYDPKIDVLAGVYDRGTIQLLRGSTGRFELSHESVHYMEDIGILSKSEISLLSRHVKDLVREGKFETVNEDDIGGQEDRANFLADELAKERPQGLLGRIIIKIRDFVDKLVNVFGERTVGGITRDIESGQIFEREGITPESNPELYALREKIQPFFSQLDKVVGQKMGGKMPIDQLIKMLKSNGVTDAEIDNVIGGIRDEGRTVTKQQVLDEIETNTTQFEDVVLGERNNVTDQDIARYKELRDVVPQPLTPEQVTEFSSLQKRIDGEEHTHYERSSEPGYVPGSYREVFVTAPDFGREKFTVVDNPKGGADIIDDGGNFVDHAYNREWAQELIKAKSNTKWEDGHSAYSDIQNPIVRIRYNERIVDNETTLRAKNEQAQKWYNKNYDELTVEAKKDLDTNVKGKKILFVEEFQGPNPDNQSKMPEALKKRIYDIGVKRILALAKEQGYDGVAWTTGEMQASRYDVSKHVSKIDWDTSDINGIKTIFFEDTNGKSIPPIQVKNGKTIAEFGHYYNKTLEELVGKDLATKINSTDRNILTGLDLKVGGEGLKYLYDKQIPSLFKKYGKEGISEISISNPSVYGGELSTALKGDSTVPYTPISQKTPSSYPQYAVQQKSPKVPTQPWDVDPPSRIDKFLRMFTDRFIDLRRVVSEIDKIHGQLADAQDPSLQQILYSAKVKDGIDHFLRDELRPMLRELKEKGGTLEGFHEFILNRHAPEANAYIASINPKLPDEGSGVKTQDALDYMKNLSPADRTMYDSLAKRYDSIAKKNLQLLVDNGLESQKTIDTWLNKYQYYAPLYRSDMEKDGGFGTGRGFSVVGPASKTRKGSVREVSNIMASISEQRERYLTRIGKNKIDMAIVALAEKYPNQDFWNLAQPTITSKISAEPATKGKMVKVVDMSYMHNDNVVMSRSLDPKTGDIVQRGVEFRIDNERAAEVVKALKNLDMDKLGIVLGLSAKVTRFISSMNTQYNIVFGIVNFIRDFQSAVLNLSTTEIAGKQVELAKGVFPALQTIYRDLRAEHTGHGGIIRTQLDQDWQDFRKHGGLVGYRDMYRNREDRINAIKNEMARVSSGITRQVGHHIASWLSDYNTTIEAGIRLSAYRIGIQNGMTKDRAAAMAKNLTLDFNKKGQISLQAGALYAFFNATAQGGVRLYETLSGPLGKKIVAGGIMLGVLQALMISASDFDEDEPPEYVRERSIIIPIGDKKYLTVPMPLGFHILPSIGRITTEWVLGDFKQPTKKFSDLLGTFIDSFNPMGSAGMTLQVIAPSPFDPIVALAENKDWTGRQIFKENESPLQPTPGFSRAKDAASGFSKSISWTLNRLSGGSEYNPGFFSPTPDQIDYLAGQIGGGATREVTKAIQAIGNIGEKESLPSHKLPLISRFYGSVDAKNHEKTQYYNNIKRLNEYELEIKGRRKEGKPVQDYIKDHPESRFVNIANKVDADISKLKKKQKILKDRGAKKEIIERIDTSILLYMKRLNDAVNAHK